MDWIRCAALGLLLAGLGGSAIWAQPAPEIAGPPAPEPPVEAFVPLPEVADRAEELDRELRAMDQRFIVLPDVERIEKELPARREELREKADRLNEFLAATPSLGPLQDYERSWTTRATELADWRRILTRRATALEGDLAELERLQQLWSKTLEQSLESGAPEVVDTGIRESLKDIALRRDTAQDRRSLVLTLQSRVSKEEVFVADNLDRVVATREDLRRRLFEPDSPPLWRAFNRVTDIADGGVRETLARNLESLRGFVAARSGSALILLLGFVLALVGARALSRRVSTWTAEDPVLGTAVHVFRRPISMAFLVAILIAPLLYPLAPAIATDIVGLLLVIPILRLLPPIMASTFRPLLFSLAVFYLTDRMRDLIAALPVAERLLFTAETAAAAVVIVALLHPSRLVTLSSEDHVPRSLGLGIRLALALFVVSLVSNLFGYFAFSKVLGEGALASIYSAVILYAAYRVFSVVVSVLVHTRTARSIGVVRLYERTFSARADRWLGIAAFLTWVYVSLGAFAIRTTAHSILTAVLTTPLTLGTVALSLGDILAFGITICAALMISGGIRTVLQEDVYPRLNLQRGIPNAVSATIHYAVLLFGFFLAVAAAGVDLSRFTLLAGAFGVGIGFGLQNVVNNFVSGLILLFERPIQVGDTVEVGGLLGDVKRIGIRSSTVRTFQGAEVIVPNGNLISDQVINWTLSDRARRVELPVGVAYGSDPERVIEILNGVAGAHSAVLRDPAPTALFRGFGDSSLDFELRFWVSNMSYLAVASDVAVGINNALAEAGIEIPFPQRDLHLRSVDPAAGAALAKGKEA